MSKHTPGPWEQDATFPWEIWSPSRSSSICTVDPHPIGHTEEDIANARLIAATPEMYEMLRGIVSLVEEHGDIRMARKSSLEVLDEIAKKADRILSQLALKDTTP